MKAKIKSLKVNLSEVPFVDPKNVRDGTNGKILETAMIKQGFPIDKTATVDLPTANVEIKTRKASSKSNHTVGTMTFDDIINTPWDETPFKQKLQQQYRVKIKDAKTASGKMVDFSHEIIQNDFREAYEICRTQLKLNGKTLYTGETIKGTQYGCLEHKPGPSKNGKSYAFRITDAGMKKAENLAHIMSSGYFSVS